MDLTPAHPADRSPMDFRMTVDEVTAYGAAWRKGVSWPVQPNPIPIEYVTRAGLLWKNGENYFLNANLTNAPAWWENLPASGAAGLPQKKSASAAPGEGTVVSKMPGEFVPAESLAVEILVQPPANVAVYAAQDQVPAGWSVKEISHGGEFDAASGQVKWGPYRDNTARALHYQASAGANKVAVASFVGVVSFDGANVPVSGPRLARATSRLDGLTLHSDGQIQIHLSGWVGEGYVLEGSTNLVNWGPLETFTNVNGMIHFNPPAAAAVRQNFYRVVAQP
jgi:hypothetical protein